MLIKNYIQELYNIITLFLNIYKKSVKSIFSIGLNFQTKDYKSHKLKLYIKSK